MQRFNTGKLTASSQQFFEMAINNDTGQMRKLKLSVIPKVKVNLSELQSSDLASALF